MAYTRKIPIYRSLTSSATISTEDWHLRIHDDRCIKPETSVHVCALELWNGETFVSTAGKPVPNTSNNFVDHVGDRELGSKIRRPVEADYGSRHMLTHEMFSQRCVSLSNVNKVLCSQWLSDREIVFGTKCKKIILYDVLTRRLDQIPSLPGRTDENTIPQNQESGIHSIQINPSKTLLATVARNSNEVAVYRLPSLDPVCVGEGVHTDLVFDMCWLDDRLLLSGSGDSRVALWRIQEDDATNRRDATNYKYIKAFGYKESKSVSNIVAVVFNKSSQELALASTNGVHVWNAETLQEVQRWGVNSRYKIAGLAVQEPGIYAAGLCENTLLIDSRNRNPVKIIPTNYKRCGIHSVSFQGNLLTIGTGVGLLLFFDLRAGKYLSSSDNSGQRIHLKTSRGWLLNAERVVKYRPAIYTHCYDSFGTRLFAAGGPLQQSLFGNYAGLWT